VIIYIPAKGHSTRIPRKNLQYIRDGVTLLEWTIRNWQRMLPGVPVVVDTDNAEIKALSLSLGCDVHHRSLIDDEEKRSGTDLLVAFSRTTDVRPIVLTQCTSPFTFTSELMTALEHPTQIVRSGYRTRFHVQETQELRSQDLPESTVITGNWLMIHGDVSSVTDWCSPEMVSPVNQITAIDINEPCDLDLCRWLARSIHLDDLDLRNTCDVLTLR